MKTFVSRLSFIGLCLLVAGCGQAAPTYTPTPTKTPSPPPTETQATPTPQPATSTPVAASDSSAQQPVAPTSPAVTATAVPPSPTNTPAAAPTSTHTPVPATPAPTAPPAQAAAEPQPPRRGGSWDMEDGFHVWSNPYEDHGGFVANGWTAFILAYQPDADPPNPPRLNENKAGHNIQSGQRSQEISFDYRAGEVGIFRRAAVTPGHRYLVEAWAKTSAGDTPVELHLGIDLTGGTDFNAETVTWYPWRDSGADRWLATQETVLATGDQMTIYLRAIHAVPDIGGNTMLDNVSITDQGP